MSPRPAFLLLPLVLAACRFQDLTPGNARHDDAAVQAAVAAFYQSLGSAGAASLDQLALPAATVLISGGGPAVLVPVRTLYQVPERRNQPGGARVVRGEIHTDGDVANDRVVVNVRSADGRHEFEATDLLTLARRGRYWRVAHAALGPWRARSAP